MPTVMFMLLAVFSVVSIGVVASIQAQSGSVRDQQTKSALASAEAGVSQALLHYNGDFTPAGIAALPASERQLRRAPPASRAAAGVQP